MLRRALRRVRSYSGEVPGELRGWRWDEPPVRPRAYLGLGVSEVAYAYCPTFRDLWLRRRGVVGEASGPVLIGRTVHEVFHRAAWDLRRLLSRGLSPWEAYYKLYGWSYRLGLPRWAVDLYRSLTLMWAGESAASGLFYGGEGVGWLPWLSEYRVDGSLLGLSSRLRVDALEGAGVVVEVKYGGGGRRHAVGLAGYALALESEFEVPYDYGIIVRVSGVPEGRPSVRVEPFFIGAELRREFLERRDEAIDVLLSGMEPPRPARCPRSCLFYSVCNGGDGR